MGEYRIKINNLQEMLEYHCVFRDVKTVVDYIKHHPDYDFDIIEALINACNGEKKDIAKYLIDNYLIDDEKIPYKTKLFLIKNRILCLSVSQNNDFQENTQTIIESD